MKTNKLQEGYYMFGNKGAVWANEAHIAHTGSETLCGTPMLSSNWARIEGLEEVNCPKCLAIYGKPTSIEWNTMMKAMQHKQNVPVMIPERFGEYMIDHFTNCLPPIVWGKDHVLCSEPYDYDTEQNKDNFIGFYKKDEIYYGVITTIVKFNALRNDTKSRI
jgi:hypothetical protein